ncbi:hypothetical protein F5X68DRAFT_257320 [Plectosphaerella plurivora]|uniref:Uncharacterized protein n=1 Tax=Plectosphaerella plurivora TaxID=936078 RepID=A0A9P9AD26_9PEZI|nr:hypothetical protein F5X68DRAFT_257320 [Plectosphaerella plurivora]
MAPSTTTTTTLRANMRRIPKSSAGISKKTRVSNAVIATHRLPSPPFEKVNRLPPHLLDLLVRRFKPCKTQAIKDYFHKLPGFDFPIQEIDGNLINLHYLQRLETIFNFPSGPRLFSEIPNDLAAEAAGNCLTSFLHFLTVAAAKYIDHYPRLRSKNAEDDEFRYYALIAEVANVHLHLAHDWEIQYGNYITVDLVDFLVNLLILGRKRVDDIHPDEGDLGCAAEQLVDQWEQHTGRI